MNNLSIFKETESEIIYKVQDEIQGLVSVPKDLKNNIKVFMMFGNNINDNLDKENELISNLTNVSKKINIGEDDGVCIVAFVDSNVLSSENAFTYTNQLNNIKNLVNKIYNMLLRDGKFTKNNFIRKIELLSPDDKYKTFMDFLCLQNPSKFHVSSYQEIMSKGPEFVEEVNNNIFMTSLEENFSQNKTTELDTNNSNVISQNNLMESKPIELTTNNNTITQSTTPTYVTEKLSINNVPYFPNVNQNFNSDNSSGGGPSMNDGYNPSVNSLSNPKTLVKKLPTNSNAAFIKWPTIVFILTMSLVIGIALSLYLLK